MALVNRLRAWLKARKIARETNWDSWCVGFQPHQSSALLPRTGGIATCDRCGLQIEFYLVGPELRWRRV